MKRERGKNNADAATTMAAEDTTPAVADEAVAEAVNEAVGEAVEAAVESVVADELEMSSGSTWDGPTRAGQDEEIANLAAASLRPDLEAGPLAGDEPEPVVESPGRLESILESLLYAADRPLAVSDLKRLVNERDAKKVAAALEALRARHADTGIQLASLAGGWQFRTHPDNAQWVAKLVAGRPQRLSRAMLEALAIVAYRQPITRPEIDEIRGVDCGPVLKTLLDRNFVRVLGKKEDVGRPMLYGTTPEFLRTFSLRDLTELPTLREFHELSEQQMASVDAQAPLPESAAATDAAARATTDAPAAGEPARSPFAPTPLDLAPVDQDEEDDLLEALDEATLAATRAAGPPPENAVEAAPEASEAS